MTTPPHPAPAPHDERTRKLSPDEINRLPMAAYDGTIHVVETPEQVESAVHALRHERLLGFDTETRPTFRKGEHYPPALLQLAGEHAVWLFKLTRLGLPPAVASILADPNIVKAGVSNARDLSELRALTSFEPAGFVDLGHVAKHRRVPHHGLRGLSAVFLGCRISKSAQLTNWARPDLPSRALQYAATDAWIGRRLYQAMHPSRPHAPATGPKPGLPRVGIRDLLRRAVSRLRRR
jgi:ribonuclease D